MKITQNRLDLMDTIVVDEIDEKDPLSVEFRDFDPTRTMSRHRVLQVETSRPDLIAFTEYGSTGYWWFILAVNGVIDPYQLTEADFLKIPSSLDYYDWFREEKGTV